MNNNELTIYKQEEIKLREFTKNMPSKWNWKEIIFYEKGNKQSLYFSLFHKITFVLLFFTTLNISIRHIINTNLLAIILVLYLYIPLIYRYWDYKKHTNLLLKKQIKYCFEYKMYNKIDFKNTILSLETYSLYIEKNKNKNKIILQTYIPLIISTIIALQFGQEIKKFIIGVFKSGYTQILVILYLMLLSIAITYSYKQNKISKNKDTIKILESLQNKLFTKNELNYKFIFDLEKDDRNVKNALILSIKKKTKNNKKNQHQ